MHALDRFLSVNGLRLHYCEWGAAAAPAVVLLHGGSAHAHWWDLFASALADHYHVLALDLRGHGDSHHADPPAYRIADYVRDVTAAVEHWGFPEVQLIGHSLGGMVAVAYASASPHRVGSLVVVDSPLRITAGGARYMARLRHFPQPVYRDRAQAIQRFRLLPTKTRADEAVLARVAAAGIRELPDRRWTLKFDREAMAHNEPQDLTSCLHRLACPILLVRGAQSAVLSHDTLMALRQSAGHAETVEIADAHHHVMLDNPVEFEGAVRGFLDKHERRQQTTDRQTTD